MTRSRIKEVDFSATSDASGMSSELLDDYEEGTWTPVSTFGSGAPSSGTTSGTGVYTKIGDLVTCFFSINNCHSSGASGDAQITGLPFASASNASLALYSGTLRASAVNMPDNGDGSYLVCEVRDGENFIRIMSVLDDTSENATALGTGGFNSGVTDLFGTLTYKV
tara:strand:- start:1062 stop:1559 length:498 start_codon:yes stop_codon:yes gene_type:complete